MEDLCSKAVDWGFEGIEFRSRNLFQEESMENYLDRIQKAVHRSGLKKVLFGNPGADLMIADDKIREIETNKLIHFFQLASERFKLFVCNTSAGNLFNIDKSILPNDYNRHGSYATEEYHWQWAVEGFKRIAAFAEEKNFRLAFETHMCYIHDLPEKTLDLVKRIDSPAVGINLDYGNIVYFKNAPNIKETICILGPYIFYVHLKNSVNVCNFGRIPVGLSDGDINTRELLMELKSIGYDGPLCLEGPRNGDREWYARQDVSYIKRIIKDLNY
jgi:Sugar phosphate isomerases/epimerases